MTGRDRSRMGILGEFLTAGAFGIDTMLALTGDHPVVGDCKSSKPVFDLDSVGILRMLTRMEQTGTDCGGNPLTATPHFYKGASVTPVYDPIYLQINKLKKKVDAGAEFVQTQGIFTIEALETFLNEVEKAHIKVHVMAGIIPLKAAGMAPVHEREYPRHRGAGSHDRTAQRRRRPGQGAQSVKGLPVQAGIEMAAELIREIHTRKLCAGVHIMAIGAEKNVPVILQKAGVSIA